MGRTSLVPNAVLLGKYRIEHVLGRGGMGVVVRARHLSLDEVVAIKVVGEEIGITPETFERFLREAKAAAKLKSMHAVRVTDVGRLEDGLPFMVMELLEGDDLRSLRTPSGVDAGLVVTAIIQTCEVLAEAHALGIVHRDIKPSNLFVTRGLDGEPFVKVLDFGIAKIQDPGAVPITRTSAMLGTPAYMSPEQLRSSRTVDHRTDLWALGVVMYELLEGTRPFASDALSELIMQIALRPPASPQRIAPGLAAIVMRALEKDPAARFQSASELASALVPHARDPGRAHQAVERIHALLRSVKDRSDATPSPSSRPERGRLVATADINAPMPAAPIPTRPSFTASQPTVAARPVAQSDAEQPVPFSAPPEPAAHAPVPIVHAEPARPLSARIAIIVGTATLLIAGSVIAVTHLKPRPHAPSHATIPADAAVEQPGAGAIASPAEPVTTRVAPVDAPGPKPEETRTIDEPTVPVTTTTRIKSGQRKQTRTVQTKQGSNSSAKPPAGSASEPCDPLKSRFGC